MTTSVLRAQQEPIIDVHVHTFGLLPGASLAETRNPITGQPTTAISVDAHEKALLDTTQRLDIVKAVVFDGFVPNHGAIQKWKTVTSGRLIEWSRSGRALAVAAVFGSEAGWSG